MNLNINQFKENIQSNGEALLDKKLLDEDMITLMDYYTKSPSECPSHLLSFIKSDYRDLTNFTMAYLSKIVNKQLSYSFTEDGWVKLFIA